MLLEQLKGDDHGSSVSGQRLSSDLQKRKWICERAVKGEFVTFGFDRGCEEGREVR